MEVDTRNTRAAREDFGFKDLGKPFVSAGNAVGNVGKDCLIYTSPSPRDQRGSRMPSSA